MCKWLVQAALHALAYIAGETRPKSSRIVDEKSEENLRCLIYDVAAQSTKLTPSVSLFSLLPLLLQLCADYICLCFEPYHELILGSSHKIAGFVPFSSSTKLRDASCGKTINLIMNLSPFVSLV